jgi:hypothetical protein
VAAMSVLLAYLAVQLAVLTAACLVTRHGIHR